MKKLNMVRKLLTALVGACLAITSARAGIIFQDSVNYPYTNGTIEGQGQWYCYTPSTPAKDALVTNNVLLLSVTDKDSVGTPTNGFYNATNGVAIFASFTINATGLPLTTNGGYFCVLQDTKLNSECHVFFDTVGVQTPGCYRLGIANYATHITDSGVENFPQDLATNVPYTVVIGFDSDEYSLTPGAFLWVNPSPADLTAAQDGIYNNVAFGTDGSTDTNLTEILPAQIGFSPYAQAGISNVMVGTAFADVDVTMPPVFGIQPQSATNYSGNNLELISVASGVDLTYQWYGPGGALTDDGVNIIGSQSNVLVLNNISGGTAGSYYVVATDANGATIASATAVITVITTPTPVFFPTNEVALKLTNNVFTGSGFTNYALGTGPITYQWYFAPTNLPITYSALAGQTSPGLSLFLADATYQGTYYLAAYNGVGAGVAYGPTNSITEIPPLSATIQQLHVYELGVVASKGAAALKNTTVYINTNNIAVSGYVTTYNGFGSSYTEFQIQDPAGYGAEVFWPSVGNNTFTPPIGTYVTVTGPLELYNTGLELAPASPSAVVVGTNAPIVIPPVLANASFNDLATNALGTNALNASFSMLTFTNVYIYGSAKGGAIGSNGSHSGVGGTFATNSYTALYFTVGGPISTVNTNTMEIFQPTYFYPDTLSGTPGPFNGLTIPTHLYQLTGCYNAYNGGAELEPSRPADYVVNPPTFSTIFTNISQKVFSLSWPVQTGSTYSVATATNLLGPWTTVASGLEYYPTNFVTITNNTGAKYCRVSTP